MAVLIIMYYLTGTEGGMNDFGRDMAAMREERSRARQDILQVPIFLGGGAGASLISVGKFQPGEILFLLFLFILNFIFCYFKIIKTNVNACKITRLILILCKH